VVIESNFQSCITEHGDYLFGFAMSRLYDEEAALDLIQETYLAAWKNRLTFDGRSALRTWLVGILKHKINDYIRYLVRQRDLMREITVETVLDKNSDNNHWLQHLPERQNCPEAQLHNRQLGEVLIFCINQLPAMQKELFTKRELADYDTATICQVHELTSGHAYVLLHRAKTALKEKLETHWLA